MKPTTILTAALLCALSPISAAKQQIPAMKEIIVMFDQDTAAGMFPPDLNKIRVGAVEDAIKAIEAATTHPELRSIKPKYLE